MSMDICQKTALGGNETFLPPAGTPVVRGKEGGG